MKKMTIQDQLALLEKRDDVKIREDKPTIDAGRLLDGTNPLKKRDDVKIQLSNEIADGFEDIHLSNEIADGFEVASFMPLTM